MGVNDYHHLACNCYTCIRAKHKLTTAKHEQFTTAVEAEQQRLNQRHNEKILQHAARYGTLDANMLGTSIKSQGSPWAADETTTKVQLEPYRLEQLALTAIGSFFSTTHPKLLGNMTLDAIVDNCYNLPEVVAYVAATTEAKWGSIHNKFIRGKISEEVRSYINQGSKSSKG